MASPASTRSHRNNFDALRLFAALLVVASHQFAVAGRWEPHLEGDHSLGNLGVLIFFSISGYLVTVSWAQDPHVPRFLARRFLRVWPALAATVSITLALAFLCLPAAQTPPGMVRYLYNLGFDRIDFRVFYANPRPNLNASLWTITFEVRWYLILAVAGFLLRERLKWAVAAAVVVGFVLFLARGAEAGFLASLAAGQLLYLPYFGAFFLAGSLLAQFRALNRPRVVFATILVGVICLVLGQTLLALFLVVPSSAIAVGSRAWSGVSRAGRFGDFSYGIYLWAWPVQQVGVLFLGRQTSVPVLLLGSLCGTALLAAASWYVVERPALGLKRLLRLGP